LSQCLTMASSYSIEMLLPPNSRTRAVNFTSQLGVHLNHSHQTQHRVQKLEHQRQRSVLVETHLLSNDFPFSLHQYVFAPRLARGCFLTIWPPSALHVQESLDRDSDSAQTSGRLDSADVVVSSQDPDCGTTLSPRMDEEATLNGAQKWVERAAAPQKSPLGNAASDAIGTMCTALRPGGGNVESQEACALRTVCEHARQSVQRCIEVFVTAPVSPL
jgi:hypothetical protein